VKPRPLATLQIDVDPLWAIAENAGSGPVPDGLAAGLYDRALGRFLELLATHGARATFFVVGRDLAGASARQSLREIAAAGHEIANHTFTHPTVPPFSALPAAGRRREILDCHARIADLTGVAPVGFKTPAYAEIDTADADCLVEHGYRYCTSSMAVSVAPLLHAIQALAPARTGTSHWRMVRRPPRRQGLVDLPLSTMPLVRLPFHSSMAVAGGRGVFHAGYALCRLLGRPLNYSFHGVDMLGREELPAAWRGRIIARQSSAEKRRLCDTIVRTIAAGHRIVTSREFIGQP